MEQIITNQNDFESQTLIESEQRLLGISMHSPNALPEIFSYLNKDDFSVSAHKIIFSTIENLYQNDKEISSFTIIDYLETNKKLSTIGGVEYISNLSGTYYTDRGLEELIDNIFKKSVGRKFDTIIRNLSDARKVNTQSLEIILNKAQTDLLNLDVNYKTGEMQAINQSMSEIIKKIKKLEQEPEELTGVTSGFSRLDKITSGFQKGDLLILAARPSMGKTAFALNLAYNAATYKKRNGQQNSVVFFSVEMPKEQLTQRILTSMTQIDPTKLRTGQNLTADEWKKIYSAKDRLENTKIFIDDTPGITIQQIQSQLHKMKRDEGINLCVIDYLQLISTPGSNGENRQNEISNISRQLKKIARDVNVPIICLSQLSRSVEKREDKRPMMSDLRDSGAIEQDADIVMFLYRDEYYKNKVVEDKTTHNLQETELIISKHRNGSTGTVKLTFNLEFGKFLDMTI